jgi:uncharacterized protein YwgA
LLTTYRGTSMPAIARRDVVLVLLGIVPEGELADGIGGIIRLQKFLYLLEKEAGLRPTDRGFEFSAYKAGPYSSKLYDDLEFLENMGLIDSEIAAEATPEEAAEVDLLNFEDLIGDGVGEAPDTLAPDAYEERRFRISDEGAKKIKGLVDSGAYQPVIDGIRKIKRRYGNYSLSDLLYYVYTKYPEMTTESEIKDKVRRRPR